MYEEFHYVYPYQVRVLWVVTPCAYVQTQMFQKTCFVIFVVEESSVLKMDVQVHPIIWYVSTKLHAVTSQKTKYTTNYSDNLTPRVLIHIFRIVCQANCANHDDCSFECDILPNSAVRGPYFWSLLLHYYWSLLVSSLLSWPSPSICLLSHWKRAVSHFPLYWHVPLCLWVTSHIKS